MATSRMQVAHYHEAMRSVLPVLMKTKTHSNDGEAPITAGAAFRACMLASSWIAAGVRHECRTHEALSRLLSHLHRSGLPLRTCCSDGGRGGGSSTILARLGTRTRNGSEGLCWCRRQGGREAGLVLPQTLEGLIPVLLDGVGLGGHGSSDQGFRNDLSTFLSNTVRRPCCV